MCPFASLCRVCFGLKGLAPRWRQLVAIVVAAAAMFFGDDLKELFGSAGKQTESVKAGVDKVDLHSTLDKANQKGGGGQQNP